MEDSWIQTLTIIGANFVLLMGMLATYITLYLHLDKKLDSNRKETNEKLDLYRRETNEILKGIQEEMKDFHNRLVTIEERNKPKIL
jgi:hypothetical protein